MLTKEATRALGRAIKKAKDENHELLVIIFDRSATTDNALEVLCSMKMSPALMREMVQEALSGVAQADRASLIIN